jgi:hypothetical protein
MKAKELKNDKDKTAAITAEFDRIMEARHVSTEIGRAKVIAELQNLWTAADINAPFPLTGNATLANKTGVDAAREREVKPNHAARRHEPKAD